MAERQSSPSNAGTGAQAGRIFIDYVNGSVDIFNTSGVLVMKIGYVGNDDDGNPMYGIANFDADGNMQGFHGFQQDGF